jgi:hypothetical protein
MARAAARVTSRYCSPLGSGRRHNRPASSHLPIQSIRPAQSDMCGSPPLHMTLRANPYVISTARGRGTRCGLHPHAARHTQSRLLIRRSGGVVQAGHHAGFLVIGVVAVHHPDAGIVRDQGDRSSLTVLRLRFWPLQDQAGPASAAIERSFGHVPRDSGRGREEQGSEPGCRR